MSIRNKNIAVSRSDIVNVNNTGFPIYIRKSVVNEGDINKMSKVNCITYKGLKELKESDYNYGDYYHEFLFDFSEEPTLKQSMIDLIIKIKENAFENENPIIKIIDFFNTRNAYNFEIEQLIGDIGEALLIMKYIELGYGKEIINGLRQKDDSLYDFYLPTTKNIIEVKNASLRSREIKINHSQMPDEKDKNVFICIVHTKKLQKTNDNHKNIFELYREIEEKIGLTELLRTKKQQYELIDPAVIDYNAIDINNVAYSIINFDTIGRLKLDKDLLSSGLKDLIYVVDVSSYPKATNEELLALIQ